METIPCNAIANARRLAFDSLSFSGIIRPPMSKKTITELEILSRAYETNPTAENSALFIKTLMEALKSREEAINELEKGIRTLELFLAEKTDCGRKKP